MQNKRKRLLTLSCFLFFLFSLLIVRFYQLQIIEGEKWTRIALAQHHKLLIEPCRRGAFFSNSSVRRGHTEDSQPFVVDVLKFHCYVDPDSVPPEKREEVARILAQLLKIDSGKVAAELAHKSRSRKVASWLEPEEKRQIENWWSAYAKKEKLVSNAVYFLSDYQRSYPFGSMLGAVLHTVREDKDPETHQSIPTGGLELFFRHYLEGKPGRRLVKRSPRQIIDRGKLLETPENGADIYLTINHHLQAMAEAELERGVKAVGARGGWAIMMDPYTGEILALAQTPAFDPSKYASYFRDPVKLEQTKVKVVTDCFEPGSIMKPITLAICMRANEELRKQGKKPIFSPEEKVATDNGWLPGRSKPLTDGRTHRFLNMNLAVQKSSNIYMARLVQRCIEAMGERWYRNALADFGFGQKTGIELPAEQSGFLPLPGRVYPNGKLEWSVPTPFSLAIGYNLLVNGLQLVRAYAMLANGGYLPQPHLVRKIIKDEQLIFLHQPKSRQILTPSITEPIIRAMKYTTKLGGTGKAADIMGYTEAGKSGTAEKIIDGVYAKTHNISSFLGFAPAHSPRFVLLVSIDDPEQRYIPGVGKQQMGGTCAAPVFREIASRALQYLGVAPDDPYGYPVGDPRRNADKADWMQELKNLQALYEEWNR